MPLIEERPDEVVKGRAITVTIHEDMWARYYEQACEARRLYSIHVKDIRSVSIVQGIVVLGGVVYLVGQGLYLEALAGIALGFLLTLTLWSMHQVYFDHSMVMQDYISKILERGDGPWTNHIASREKRLRGKIRYALFKHAVFLLLALSLLAIAAVTAFKAINHVL